MSRSLMIGSVTMKILGMLESQANIKKQVRYFFLLLFAYIALCCALAFVFVKGFFVFVPFTL